MFIFTSTKKRAPAYPAEATYVDEDGTMHIGVPMRLLTEIDDPQPPVGVTELTHDRFEIDGAPYVEWKKKPADQIARTERQNTNSEALAYLLSTDWMVMRYAETGEAIPASVKTLRQKARDSIVHEDI